ncbi:poly-beta-1,6-N-acetyl-D-glucosamine N-deacetylase PgaB [Salinisphaera sp. LB1]|uniref:poly-beta-1,6-N-acetyl-D-glucosamine N-deacetylase PgaB n=1 Tax=Salinisphaera sp. LB1 TaxID=2183911 RepID=UPI000D705ADC|nr:poly-beta-1,6-N-acetyl-D-glucosamine N-deacetylase PgaB [Salinisphaera sp. LB1]AWN15853.1 Biofilm PGA synthesis deacetylase PgaB [Salinisphaera sp. LB1]
MNLSRRGASFFPLLFLLAFLVARAANASDPIHFTIPPGHFVTLNFHDVRKNVVPVADHDPYAISTQRLAKFFDWMKTHDWHPVSLGQIIAAHKGRKSLPPNAVLLSFDDGLESVYSKLFPLLQAFDYPALVAVETRWIEHVHGSSKHKTSRMEKAYIRGAPTTALKKELKRENKSPNIRKPGKVFYEGQELGGGSFLTWAQIRAMQRSGLVAIAVHTQNLHHGVLANPQGNKEPAAITRIYNPATRTYESNTLFRQRIRYDLKFSKHIITERTGRVPRAVVWPYGALTPEVTRIAHSVGLALSFGLGDRHISSVKHIGSLGRFLISEDPKPEAIEAQVRRALHPPKRVKRAVQVDMDDIYSPDPKQVNKNLGALLDRIKAMHINTVYLQAFADPDGDGTANALYFPNSYLPMRADLFNRVAWQLSTRAGVKIYAWLPLLAFKLPNAAQERALSVARRNKNGTITPVKTQVRRLSPFRPKAQHIIRGIYADLARNYSALHGVLIGDDATLHAHEGARACTPGARWPGPRQQSLNCPLQPRTKTNALIALDHAATGAMHPYLNSSNHFGVTRNLFARVVTHPMAEGRFAQALGPFLKNYGHVALMAMPYLDDTQQAPKAWLRQLVKDVAAKPQGLKKTVFELQTRNWARNRWIPASTLTGWMHELIGLGAVNLAYYPDDFLSNRPPFKPIFQAFSLNQFPHLQSEP